MRNGLNFTERGFGVRAARGLLGPRATPPPRSSSRATSTGTKLFGQDGVRWFHTGGIFAALSETTPAVAQEAMQAAKRHGTIVSYDLNYRDSLWKGIGGAAKAQEVNRELASYVDVMIGNEEDFTACLGLHVEGVDENFSALDPSNFKKMIELARAAVPELPGGGHHPAQRQDRHASTTGARSARTATSSTSPALREDLEIYDRVGGGDSFASGLIYGFLAGKGPAVGGRCGAAHGALAMTTPGDTSMATLDEVLKVMKGGGARVSR